MRSGIAKPRKKKGSLILNLNPKLKTIFVFGGSLGASSMNKAMAAQEELLAGLKEEVQVLWQCGSLYWETYKDCATAQLPNVHIRTFIDRMDLAYAMADVVVGRAGALTISELCVAQKAVVLIPSPNVAEDHQTKNAKALADRDSAVLVLDKDAEAEILRKPLEILGDEKWRLQLEKNIKQLAKPEAAEKIAAEVLALLKE